jgi:hypothetical protein
MTVLPIDESDASDDAFDGFSTRFQKFTRPLRATDAGPALLPLVARRVVCVCPVMRAESRLTPMGRLRVPQRRDAPQRSILA